jgi:hypothetical protein
MPWRETILISAWPAASSGHRQAAFGVFQHNLHLLAGDTRETSQEVVYLGAVFEVLKQSAHWHTVVLNTQAPLPFPGTRSTAAH